MLIKQAEFSVDSDLNCSFGFIEIIPVYISWDLAHLIMLQELMMFGLEIQEGPFSLKNLLTTKWGYFIYFKVFSVHAHTHAHIDVKHTLYFKL